MTRRFPILLGLALAIWLLFGVLELLGLRDWVSVLSGTPAPGLDFATTAAGGALYAITYFAAVIVAPVFALAEVLVRLSGWIGAGRAQEAGASRQGSGA